MSTQTTDLSSRIQAIQDGIGNIGNAGFPSFDSPPSGSGRRPMNCKNLGALTNFGNSTYIFFSWSFGSSDISLQSTGTYYVRNDDVAEKSPSISGCFA